MIRVGSGGSSWARARSEVVALPRHRTVIAFGIRRRLRGTVASIGVPIATSSALQDAIACTVLPAVVDVDHLRHENRDYGWLVESRETSCV